MLAYDIDINFLLEKMELIIKRVGVLKRLTGLIETKSPLLKIQALQAVSRFSERRKALAVRTERRI